MSEPTVNNSGSKTPRLLSLACVVTVAVMALSIWTSYDSFGKFSRVSEDGLRLQELRGEILRYDEILTMSARMAAATGDLAWEARYWETEPKLTKALEAARQLVPDLRTTDQTEASNEALIALEEQALSLTKAGRLSEAQAILSGNEYRAQKRVYAQGMQELGEQLEQVAVSTTQALRDRAALQIAGSLLALPLLIGGWWFVLRIVNRWRRDVAASNRKLTELNRDLDDKVRERTAALAEATEEAQAASKAKSTFLANMSHELRTPMNAILGYSEMLIEEAEDSEQEESVPDLKKINDAGKHLLGLINDVLDISKIEAGRMELFLETFDVAPLVETIVSTVQPLIVKNGNELIVDCEDGLAAMHADVTKLRQALLNLLSNAAKFTENGTITLTAAQGEEPGTIRFDVTDTGVGIPPDRLDVVFEAFAQADDSTTRNFGGTGLGLPISREFCRMMGGDVTASSDLGKGSTFTIVLPREVGHDPSPAEEVEQPDGGDGPLVLVIDDDPTARDLICKVLQRDGFRVVTAGGAEDGLRLARERHPMAITLDILMPGTDGWSVLASLKQDPALQDIPVVMVSMLDEDRLAQALGASDYMTKPVDRARLSRILNGFRSDATAGSVLIVEDDPDIRNMLQRLVTKEGWVAATAENGSEGLAQLAAARPDVIFTDLMMPVMDGFDFVDELRRMPEWRDVPVIVLTAKDLTEEDRRRLNGHVERVLDKGSEDADSLLARLHDLVGTPSES